MARLPIFIQEIFVYWQLTCHHSGEKASICQLHLTDDLLIALIFQKGHDIFLHFCLILNCLLNIKWCFSKRGWFSRTNLFHIVTFDWDLAKKILTKTRLLPSPYLTCFVSDFLYSLRLLHMRNKDVKWYNGVV